MIIFQPVLKPGVVNTPVNYTVHHQSFPVLITVCRKMQVYEAAIAEAQADGGISKKGPSCEGPQYWVTTLCTPRPLFILFPDLVNAWIINRGGYYFHTTVCQCLDNQGWRSFHLFEVITVVEQNIHDVFLLPGQFKVV